ncbi:MULTISPECIES: quinone oxidoreductase [unclassified Providencia]|uniref:quinone oxidoreductase n=1 Tax=unclassified Providencia TaxID=2633465 RepID=UPI000E89724E|nr:quinone oxidoreductase [Providencia sp.]MBP6083390.1 quinone oxidoreductase [Providencia sp.]HBO22421.1 quinone oxidoreductase [Providencia sp.]
MAKRIEFAQAGGPEVLNFVDYSPNEPTDNEIQIENHAIGINFIDTYVRSGLYPVANLPAGLGTEAAGIVVKTGSQVTGFRPGDRVVYAQGPLGAYSEIHNVPESAVAHLPNDISFKQAAACSLKGMTVYYLLNQTYQVKRDEIFLFHAAAGGVGLIACQWAKALGAKMIGTVGSDEKALRAKDAGAWQVINYQTEDIAARVKEITDGEKVNVVYDSVGQATWLASLDSLKRKGLMVSFGNASGPVTGVNLGILNQKGSLYVTRPSLSGYVTNRAELDQASKALFDMILSGKLNVDVPESQIFALKDAQQAHRIIEQRHTQGSSLLIP